MRDSTLGDRRATPHQPIDARLAAYVAAVAAIGAAVASDAQAVVVGNSTEQSFGVNGDVSIDFNSDGQTDFQIDHDRVDLGESNGGQKDFLQVDKNDINGAGNPLAFDPLTGFQAATFPPGATVPNDANNSGYVTSVQGAYPSALTFGELVGPLATFDYQESDNFQGSGKWIRAQRLIDEDATQIDQVLGGRTPAGVQVPFNGPNFLGLAGDVRYVGVKMELNNSGLTNYGWIGIRIDNEADATGAVVGYAYETTPEVPIGAGVVPEPTSLVLAGAMLGTLFLRRARRSKC
jgi:hypothetical protein